MEKKQKNGKPKQVGNGNGSYYYSEKLQKWIFQYVEPNGKRQTMTQKKNESSTAFKKRVTEVQSKLDSGTYIGKSKDTFISILEAHVKQKYDDGLVSARTYSRDLATINQIKKCCFNFINKPIQQITVTDIEKSKKNMREYSNSIIQKMWILINKTFRIAYSRRKIPFNIMLDETLTKPLSKKEDKKIESLSVDEENKLINILNNQEYNHKYRDIILLQLYTGMRIGEVLALSKNCVDFKNNTLTVYRTLTQDDKFNVVMGKHTKTYKKSTGIDNGKRTFPMNSNVKRLIEKILNYKTTNINGLLFWDYKNNDFIKPYEINSYLLRLNKKYNITTSLHSHRLRHTFITRCVEKGMNYKVLQTIVGHVDGSTITNDIYTSVSNEFMNEELKKIN